MLSLLLYLDAILSTLAVNKHQPPTESGYGSRVQTVITDCSPYIVRCETALLGEAIRLQFDSILMYTSIVDAM